MQKRLDNIKNMLNLGYSESCNYKWLFSPFPLFIFLLFFTVSKYNFYNDEKHGSYFRKRKSRQYLQVLTVHKLAVEELFGQEHVQQDFLGSNLSQFQFCSSWVNPALCFSHLDALIWNSDRYKAWAQTHAHTHTHPLLGIFRFLEMFRKVDNQT